MAVTASFFLLSFNAQAQLITFDDLNAGDGIPMPAGYQGFSWSNFAVVDPQVLYVEEGDAPSGYQAGTVSGSNIAYNGAGEPASITSSTAVNFNSAYITAAWEDGLSVQVLGYNGSNLVYNTTVDPSATSATLFTFDYNSVTSVEFISSGGTPHLAYGDYPGDEEFALDNVTFSPASAPESSTLFLLAAGVALIGLSVPRRGHAS